MVCPAIEATITKPILDPFERLRNWRNGWNSSPTGSGEESGDLDGHHHDRLNEILARSSALERLAYHVASFTEMTTGSARRTAR